MNAAKIRLSPRELELVTGTRFILTKNSIQQKSMELLGILQTRYRDHLQDPATKIPAFISQSSPRISRGENYLGLPWLMLDYPRLFNRQSVRAIRTMFWWGKFFSITLHVSGEVKQKLEQKIISAYPSLKKNGFSLAVNDDEWVHHFGKDNYRSLRGMTANQFVKYIRRQPFVKLARQVPVRQWDKSPDSLYRSFVQLVEILEN